MRARADIPLCQETRQTDLGEIIRAVNDTRNCLYDSFQTAINALTMTVKKCVLEGTEVAVVTVWPADAPPARFKGRIWIRTGSRCGIAPAQDERILNEKRRHRDIPLAISPVKIPARSPGRSLLWSLELPSGLVVGI